GELAVAGILAVPYVHWATKEQMKPGREPLGRYYQRMGTAALALDAEFAALHFQECLRWYPFPDCRMGWGQWLLQQGRAEEAIPELEAAVSGYSQAPGDVMGALYLSLGQAYLTVGRTEEGLAHVREAAARAPPGSALRQESEKLLNARGGP
ncbi:hypothetical protein, partial [Corallococcus llansteffanensis]